MLRCRKDTTGVVDLTLTQIGLFLATAILLTVVFSLVFSNDWQRTAELQSITSNFSNLLEDLANSFFEKSIQFQFPEKNYEYLVRISTEYISVYSKGLWSNHLLVTDRFVTRPWPRLPTQNWTTGDELHLYLNETYGYSGNQDDPIPSEHFIHLLNEQNRTISFFAMQPLEITIRKPLILEKVSIHYDLDQKHDFLLIYQR